MRMFSYAAALGLAAALPISSFALPQSLTSSPVAPNSRAPFAQNSGIVVQGKAYPSWQAWNSSPQFKAQGRRCGTPAIDLALAAPSFAAASDCNFSQTNTLAQYDPGALYTIQVVVHVIETTSGTGNISAAMVQSQIDILNEDFSALSGTPGSGGVDTKIQFELASVDPGGSPTTGITYSTSNSWFSDSGSYWNSLAWDPDKYLNIYTNDAGGNLGYVPYLPPNGNSGNTSDRVVVLYSSFGRNSANWPYHQGRTTTHEVGHYLGLLHTFEGGCGGGGCSTSGDLICDTNAESSSNYGCATSSISCGSPDPVRNYMDYSDDTCMTGFTADQANRMRCTLENWRSTLYTVGGPGGPADDIYEENDSCGIAAVIAPGTDLGLNVAKTDEDYYQITLANGATLDIDLAFSNANGDIDCYLYDAIGVNCGDKASYVVRGYTGTDDESITWVNNTGAAKTYWFQVNMYDSASNADDNSYDMTVAVTGAPVSDDAFEDNDNCGSAWSLAAGSYPNLTVRDDDEDYFLVNVPSGATIDVSALHTAATADIDIYLYASQGDCTFDNWLVRGYTGTDDEQMDYTNAGAAGSYVIKVHIWNNSGPENEYDLIVDVTSAVTVATSFCTGEGTDGVCPCFNWSVVGSGEGCTHSLGYGALLEANGSNSFAADDLSFTVTQARPGQPGLLLQGSVAITTPFKDGILCMGSPTRRLEVIGLDAFGSGTTTSSIVTEGNIAGPGVIRFYQMWYRDPGGSPCGSGSNFSQGLQVDWQ